MAVRTLLEPATFVRECQMHTQKCVSWARKMLKDVNELRRIAKEARKAKQPVATTVVPRLVAMLGIAPPSVAKDADPDALPAGPSFLTEVSLQIPF